MKSIAELDPNFRAGSIAELSDVVLYDAQEPPFALHGLLYDNRYRRLPEQIAKTVSSGVTELSVHTAGGRLRFVTDSPYVALSCSMQALVHMPHMPLSGSSGFDLYADGVFAGSFIPPTDTVDGFGSVVQLDGAKKRVIEIGFPLYNDVIKVWIGLQEGASLETAPAYPAAGRVVYYGSSITQGGCVSRPGNFYPAIVSRRLGIDYVNLGFSGNAKGEDEMANYIAGLDMTAFVFDYDHNAPDLAHLERTHERFYRIVREKRPDLPILMISMPNFRFCAETAAPRREVIRRTYQNAVVAGDDKVRFIDGETLWGDTDWELCTMDKCHPNDLGNWRMSEVITPVVKEML